MSKFKVLVTGRGTLLASFESYEEARNIAIKEAKSTGKETCVMEVKSTHNPGDIDSYETAKTYLGEDAIDHQKTLLALAKLIEIAEVWNKVDDFTPDCSNPDQYKYYPWFKYDSKSMSFVYADASEDYEELYTESVLGPLLCFKTEERAEQFGTQFIDLWNDFLSYL